MLSLGELKALEALLSCEMGDSVHELFEEFGADAMDCLKKLQAAVKDETPVSIGFNGNDPYEHHQYCKICRECVTCFNEQRPCRNGGQHEV